MINQSQIKIDRATLSAIVFAVQLGAISDVRASSDADYSFLIDSDWHSCQQINPDYQEVYAFETNSFYVNICQKDDLYFYSGEAKQRDANSIFIPAIPLADNRGFQAINGNLSYVVILPFKTQIDAKLSPSNPNEAILTIKRNGRLVEVESSLNKYCHQSEAIALNNMTLNSHSFERLATVPQQQDIHVDLLSKQTETSFSKEIFNSNSHFDFYQINGKIHRLTTCN